MVTQEDGRLLAVMGPMGVGKSTVIKQLSTAFGFIIAPENFQENEFLEQSVADPKQFAAQCQNRFLDLKLQSIRTAISQMQVIHYGNRPRIVLVDTPLPGDKVFAQNHYLQGNMTEDDWQKYLRHYEQIQSLLPPFLGIIHLQASLTTLMNRILDRGRPFEMNTPEVYVNGLRTAFDELADKLDAAVLTVQTDTRNFRDNSSDIQWFIEKVSAFIAHPTRTII